MYCNIKVVQDFLLSMLCLYDFILDVPINIFFSHVKTGLPGIELVLSKDISRGREFDPGPVPYFRGD